MKSSKKGGNGMRSMYICLKKHIHGKFATESDMIMYSEEGENGRRNKKC